MSTAPRSLTARAREDGHLAGLCTGLHQGREQAFHAALNELAEEARRSPEAAEVLARVARRIDRAREVEAMLTAPHEDQTKPNEQRTANRRDI